MRGNILTKGVISGNDGNRYNYKEEDIQDERIPNNGDEVDFIVENGVVKDIFIMKQKLSNSSAFNISTDVGKVRMMAMSAFGFYIFGSIPVLFFLQIIGAFLIFSAIYKFAQIAESKTLFKNYLIGVIVAALGSSIIGIGLMSALIGGLSSGYSSVTSGGTTVAVFGLILVIIGLIWKYKAYKELSVLSDNKFFLYAFFCYLVGGLTTFFIVGIFVFIAGYILELIAWNQLKEIKKVN